MWYLSLGFVFFLQVISFIANLVITAIAISEYCNKDDDCDVGSAYLDACIVFLFLGMFQLWVCGTIAQQYYLMTSKRVAPEVCVRFYYYDYYYFYCYYYY